MEQRRPIGKTLGLQSKRSGVSFPASPLEFQRLVISCFPSCDMAEIPLKRRKSAIQLTNQPTNHNIYRKLQKTFGKFFRSYSELLSKERVISQKSIIKVSTESILKEKFNLLISKTVMHIVFKGCLFVIYDVIS